MNIVFCGTPEFAVPFLISLIHDEETEVSAVVTQPDKPVGRKKIITPPPVKVIAEENDIPILQPETIKNNNEFATLIKGLEPDFIVVVAYGMILPEEILEIPKYDCINAHASLLPKYRGASPIQSALLNGDTETGISIMKIEKTLDTGDVYVLRKAEITPDDTTLSLSQRLSEIGAIMLPSTLKDIRDGILSPIAQNDSEATHCAKISKKDAFVDMKNETAEQIINKLRAFTPWPGIFMEFDGKRLKILIAKIDKEQKIAAGEFKHEDSKLFIGTKKDALELISVQPEGKNVLSAKDFINGFLK